MSYQLTFSLYTTAGLADLRAQLFDIAGTNSGAAVSTGFVEVGTNGMYLWTGTIPDSFIGGVKFYSLAAASDILGICAINPLEAENAKFLPSIRASTVGRAVSDGNTNPEEVVYYDEDGTTPLFTHVLTNTVRTVS